MKSIRLLHITDFHFGSENKEDSQNGLDLKDSTIDPVYTNKLGTHWSQQFFECIQSWETKSSSKIDIIVCTGDLGSFGKADTIEEGVAFLEKLCKNIDLPKDKVIICPGNHDLQRSEKGVEFFKFEEYLKKTGFLNYSCYEKIFEFEIKGIPIIAINSCIGGTEVSNVFMEQYVEKATNITRENKKIIVDMLLKNNMEYLSDFLDIPSIGAIQKHDLLKAIRSYNTDNVILLMHHNPLPNNSIELRPYCNVVDSGNVISELINTEKKVFILHGHTHYNYNVMAYFPPLNENYLSLIGCGPLNGTQNSKANILEFYYTNENKHIITKIHNIYKSGGAGYSNIYSHNIYDKNISIAERKINTSHIFDSKSQVTFSELKKIVQNQVNDEDLLKVILKEEQIFLKIDKKGSDNYNDWLISKKNN